jgi:hypothetical protein
MAVRPPAQEGPHQPARAKVAGLLQVVRSGAGNPARLYIDGALFPYATVEGYTVHPQRTESPSVALRIAAYRVEVIDAIEPPKPSRAPPKPIGELAATRPPQR